MRSMISDMAAPIDAQIAASQERLTRGPDGWLSLAAAPTFAIMALVGGIQGAGMPDVLCSAMHHTSFLTGMVPMYLLMSAFHMAPWLRLLSTRRNAAGRA
jgi:hypothetical protein